MFKKDNRVASITIEHGMVKLLTCDGLNVLDYRVLLANPRFFREGQVSNTREELSSLEGRFKVLEDDLAYLEANDETDSLQARLAVERAKPQPQALPSQVDVQDFSNALFGYAATQGLSFSTFDKVDTSVSIGDTSYPSLRHSLEAQGTGAAQTGLLQLISEFPTAKVLDLVFTRAGNPAEWHMRLELDVFYR